MRMTFFRKILNHICGKNMSNTFDNVTGLSNRIGLYEYYNSLKEGDKIHVIFIDIDNFRQVNDVFGHSAGDKLLERIGRCILESSENGFVSRTGGDEYILFLDGKKSENEVSQIIENIMNNINNTDYRKDILSIIGVSVGVVLNQNVTQSLDGIFTKCKIAIYQAKANGKNQFVIYSSQDPTMLINKNIEAEMEKALAYKEFLVYLQPKVNMLNNSVIGAEALSRWDHPVDGIRMPFQFIQLFEKNGFILKLDMYIFEEVCKIKKSWKNTILEKLPISLNMDRLHFYQNDLPDRLLGLTKKYDINPNEIDIEITESMFFKNTEQLINIVLRLKDCGFKVSIDDFGSGYSALNMIKDVPSDTIKIDRIFLKESVDSNRGKKIIKNVINMCREIKVQIVAEGVETKEHIDFLTGCGCLIAQGFFYSKPIPVEAFERFATVYRVNDSEGLKFTFNNTTLSQNNQYEATYVGDKYGFLQGPRTHMNALKLYGGEKMTELMELPAPIFYHDSYTVALWVFPEKIVEWGSFIYVKYENGYFTISMDAVDGKLTYRIRDIKEIEGWHDVTGEPIKKDTWTHITVSYDYASEVAKLYVNGELVNSLEEVPTLSYARVVYLGGDVYKDSLQGCISDLVIYGEVKTDQEVKELYEKYNEH